MTNPHQIGELLRAGVRPTEEETEHLRALGGFVAAMYGRYLDGQGRDSIATGSDDWSRRLSGRLAASTAERWGTGLGLADMLLDSGFGNWWNISRDGFAAGYGDFEAEMDVLALFDEEPEAAAAPVEEAAAPRRRRSLFGPKGQQVAQRGRLAPAQLAKKARALRPMMVAAMGGEAGAAARPQLAARWFDGSLAELTVLEALAAGGLHTADQVADVLEAARMGGLAADGGARAEARPASQAIGATALDGGMMWIPRAAQTRRGIAGEAAATIGASSARGIVPRVNLDGLRIDERTPALAAALGRAEAVFGGSIGLGAGASLNSARLEAMTSAAKVSIDRGLGTGERPVFGFYDAAESTFLSLPSEATPPATVAEGAAQAAPRAARGGRRAATARSSAARDAGLPILGRSVAAATQRGFDAPAGAERAVTATGVVPGLQAAQAARAAGAQREIATSLGAIAPARGGRELRPYTGGVFAAPQRGQLASASFTALQPNGVAAQGGIPAAAGASGAEGSFGAPMARSAAPTQYDVATRVAYTTAGQPVAAVQRGAMSAPRMFVSTFAPGLERAQAPFFADVTQAAPPTGGVAVGSPFAAAPAFTSAALTATQNVRGEAGVTMAGSMPTASWRLAADGGRDLPLGATFSRPELFGATRALDVSADVRSVRGDFKPLVARTPEDGAVQVNRLAGQLDGLVWVTAPADASAAVPGIATAAEQAMDLRLAAVPSGRRAAMVPAAQAFSSIAVTAAARSNAASMSFATAPGADATVPAAARALGQMVAPEAFSGVAPSQSATAARAMSMLRSGILTDVGVSGMSMVPMALQRMLEARAEGVGPGASVAGVGASPVASVPATAGFEGIAAPRAGTMSAVAGEGVTPRWLESVLRGAEGTNEVAAARWIRDAVVEAGYGQLDGDRVMLAIAEARAADVAGASAADGTTGDVPRARALRTLAKRGGTVAQAAPARIAAARAAAVRGGVSAQAVQTATRRAAGATAGVAPGALGATDTGVAAQAPFQGAVSVARQALMRSVMTARETRALADVLAPRGVMAMAAGASSSVAARQDFTATSLRLAARESTGGAAFAAEPMLSRLVSAARAESADIATIAPRWDVDGGLVERIAQMGGSERSRVARTLADAGWTAAELQLLSLDAKSAAAPSVTAPAGTARSAEAGEREDDAQAAPAVRATGSRDTARVARMGQSLARVISGNEALGGSVVDTKAGTLAQTAARAQAATWLPLLGAKPDAYFGALAPASQAGSSRQQRVAALQDAVGELVRMAEAEAATSDTAVAGVAHRDALRRTLAVRERLAATSRMTSSTSRDGIGQAALGGVLAPTASGLATGADWRPGRGEIASAVEQGLVERTTARAAVETVGTSALASAGGDVSGAGVPEMRVPEAERTMVGLAANDAPMTADAIVAALSAAGGSRSGLGHRVAEALALSASGPAGARRLARAMLGGSTRDAQAQAQAEAQQRPTTRAARAAAEAAAAEERAAARAQQRTMVSRAQGLRTAEVSEEATRSLPIGLGQVLAPEVMLSGLRSPELARAVKAIATRQAAVGWDSVGVLTTLNDAGIDLGAARTSLGEGGDATKAAQARRAGAAGAFADSADGRLSPAAAAMVRDAASLGGATQRALVEVLAGGDAESVIARANLGAKQKAGLLSAVLRGTERAERASLLERAGGSDFAFAWLARVDGSRSGVDIGLGETKAELGRTFGKRRESTLAGASPMQGASLVGPAAAPGSGEDKSGLRSVASKVASSSTGGARPQHGASDAMRRTDWRFVETGSRASTAHADLGKLAAAIVGNSESGKRAPMPLVAPAAKAVAQTALRKGGSESVASSGGGGGGGGGSQKRGGPEPKLSEKAIEALAVEMANRVARLMGLMKERMGVW